MSVIFHLFFHEISLKFSFTLFWGVGLMVEVSNVVLFLFFYFPRKKTLMLVCGTEQKIWCHWKWNWKNELIYHLKDRVVGKMLGTKTMTTRSMGINKIMLWKCLCFQVIFSVNAIHIKLSLIFFSEVSYLKSMWSHQYNNE